MSTDHFLDVTKMVPASDVCSEVAAAVAAERERCYAIVMRAPYEQKHDDDDDGWGDTEQALKAMAFDITAKIRGA
jgi:hypothetical protein